MKKTTKVLINFQWVGINRSGKICNGIIGAEKLAIARAELQQQGIIIRQISKKRNFHFPFDFFLRARHRLLPLLSLFEKKEQPPPQNHGHSAARPLLGIRIGARVEGDDHARGERAGEKKEKRQRT